MKSENEIKDYIVKIYEDILKYQKDEFPLSKESQALWEGYIGGLEWVLKDKVSNCPTCGKEIEK